MYCISCANHNPRDPERCPVCGAPSRLRPLSNDAAPGGFPNRRRFVAGLPVALLIAVVLVAGASRLNEERVAAEIYAEAENALAVGDLLQARERFSAAGTYRDAEQRVLDVDEMLLPYQLAYEEAASAFNAGRFDDAIAILLPVIRALPDDAESFALLEQARTERWLALERQATNAEDARDWYTAEKILAVLAEERADEPEFSERLNAIRTNHSPFVYSRAGGVYVGGADQLEERPVVEGMNAAWPVWSPDRTRIAFVTFPMNQREINGQLYVVNADGTDLKLLTSAVLPFGWPAWSPDGTRIAFTSAAEFNIDTGEGHIGLFVAEVGSGVVHDVSGERYDFAASPSWAPDGKRIAFIERRVANLSGSLQFENGDVWVVNLESEQFSNLTGDDIDEERQVTWSPAGDRLAVITDPGDWNNEVASEIFLIDVSTGEIVNVPSGRHPGPPVWSPDGERLAFVENDNVVRVWAESGVRWIPTTTSIDTLLTWSPDGNALFAPASTLGQPSYVVSLEAGAGPPAPIRLTFDFGNGANGPPVWAPRTAQSRPVESAGTALDPPR